MAKLSVTLGRQIGDAGKGGRIANVQLELELDANVTADADRLQEQARRLFLLARAVVDEELDRAGPCTPPVDEQVGSRCHAPSSNNDAAPSRSNGNERWATVNQVKAITAICKRNRFDLPGVLGERFGVERPEDLTLQEASSLIAELTGSAKR